MDNPNSPLSPSNPLNPLNPLSPFNPLNPIGIYQATEQAPAAPRPMTTGDFIASTVMGLAFAIVIFLAFKRWL